MRKTNPPPSEPRRPEPRRSEPCPPKSRPRSTHPRESRPNDSRHRDFRRGEVYHIYQRGNFKQKVFHSWMQAAHYRNRLFYLALRYKVRIHTFCLMANHIHLVLEPSNKLGIGLLMRDLQSGHALLVNTSMGVRGNLWQQNYRAKHIDSPSYYRTVLHYVETNPVKAGCVAKAEDYWWSGAAVHVAKQPIEYSWQYPEGFGSKSHRWGRCIVKLHLTRWKQEFGPDINWSAYLANPHDRLAFPNTPPPDPAALATLHQQDLAKVEAFVREAQEADRFERAKTQRNQLRKGKGGNQFVRGTRYKKPPLLAKLLPLPPKRLRLSGSPFTG